MGVFRSRFAESVDFGAYDHSPLQEIRRGVRRLTLTMVCLTVALAGTSAAGAAVRVVASIKPVHSLVAAVMLGAGEPVLIIQGATSPHSFSLRPSDARNIQNAEIIFLIGDALESSLAGSIDTLGRNARVVRLFEIDGLMRLPLREGETFEGHDHEGEGNREALEGETLDMHVWLDPVNARTMVRAIADALSSADAGNAATYACECRGGDRPAGHATRADRRDMDGVRGRPFIVLHDAFHYFESRFGLIAAGAALGLAGPLARRAADHGVEGPGRRPRRCLCADRSPVRFPACRRHHGRNFGTAGHGGPAGRGLDGGPDLYFNLLNNMAASFRDCLAEQQGLVSASLKHGASATPHSAGTR